MEIQYGQCDFVRPGRALLQPNPVSGASEEIAGRDEVTVASGLELQPRAVPDEGMETSGKGEEEGNVDTLYEAQAALCVIVSCLLQVSFFGINFNRKQFHGGGGQSGLLPQRRNYFETNYIEKNLLKLALEKFF